MSRQAIKLNCRKKVNLCICFFLDHTIICDPCIQSSFIQTFIVYYHLACNGHHDYNDEQDTTYSFFSGNA